MGGNLPAARRALTKTVADSFARLPDAFRKRPVALCLSGGTDSSALALACSDLRTSFPETFERLFALHVRHDLRGSESDGDAASVRELCGRSGLSLQELDAPMATGPGLESRAREARYRVLREAAPDAILATGHQQDDQAETVVLRLLRGAGPRGLVGIRPKRDDGIWRPLLDTTRGVLRSACREAGWVPREDSSNADRTFRRNEIRLDLLPAWEREEPGVSGALAALARSAWELEPFLERALDRMSQAISLRAEGKGISLDLSGWPSDRALPHDDPELDLLLERAWTRTGRRPWARSHRAKLLCDLWAEKTGRRRGGQGETAHFGGRRLRVEIS